jgi:hypothetical protein
VPLPTELPPESLVELETSGVVTVAPTALENANISPAIAKTVESPNRAARSASDRVLARLVRIPRTGVILALHGLLARGTMHPHTRAVRPDVGEMPHHLAGQRPPDLTDTRGG